MSDDNNQPPKPNPLKTQPIKKTSAVPLRKETVRVTLKAPGAAPGTPPPPTAPIAAPTIPLSNAAPKPPVAPMAQAMSPDTGVVEQKADAPGVKSTAPLKQETMRVTLKADGKSGAPAAPAPAPTIPLGRAASAPTIPLARAASAPTIPLARAASAAKPVLAAPTVPLGGAPTIPLATAPLKAGASSQPLPKATVQLQQTQQLTQGLGTPSQAATIQTVSDDEFDNKRESGAALPLSIVAFLLSLVVMYFCIQHSKIWVETHEDGEYMSIFEASEE